MKTSRILAATILTIPVLGAARVAEAITVPDLGSTCSTSNGGSGCFKITNNHTTGQFAISGIATGTANAVNGTATNGSAFSGTCSGTSATAVSGVSNGTGTSARGVFGQSVNGTGVSGTATGNGATATGVLGQSNGTGDTAVGVQGVATGAGLHTKGVYGLSQKGYGVYAATNGSGTGGTPGLTGPAGLFATSTNGHGVLAITTKDSSAAAAVYGYTATFGAFGVIGHQAGNDSGTGVLGMVTDAAGNLITNGFAVQGIGGGISIYGNNQVGGVGVYGQSTANNAVWGVANGTSSVAGLRADINPAADEFSGAVVGDAQGSGTVWAGKFNGDVEARGFYATSDARLKKDIKDASYGLPELMKLRPVSYKWKTGADLPAQNGFIAQEVKKVFPNAVRGNAKLSINYIELLPVAIKSIQQQQETILRQEKRIAELEARGAPLASSMMPALGGWAALGLLPVGMLIGRLRRRRQGQ